MAFDLRYWLDNGLENNITCHSDAHSVCGNLVVLVDGYEDETVLETVGEENICEIKQCPLQCPDGNGGFDRFENIKENLDDLDENTDCIRAIVEIFANNNSVFTDTFARAFTKMIQTGYKNDDDKLTQIE